MNRDRLRRVLRGTPSGSREVAAPEPAPSSPPAAAVGEEPLVDWLLQRLPLGDPIHILDVGANPLTDPPYQPLVGRRGVRVVGFEPLTEAYEELVSAGDDSQLFFNAAVGGGNDVELYEYNYSGFTSAFRIDPRTADFLNHWDWGIRLKTTHRLSTVRLDDMADLPPIDLLKIDVQGGELEIFRNARSVLRNAACIITEVSFLPLYLGAPSHADIHLDLTAQGFLLHKFLHTVQLPLRPTDPSLAARLPGTQLVDGDAVYIRDLRDPDRLTDHALASLALFAGAIFNSPGLALRALELLAARGAVPAALPADYAARVSRPEKRVG